MNNSIQYKNNMSSNQQNNLQSNNLFNQIPNYNQNLFNQINSQNTLNTQVGINPMLSLDNELLNGTNLDDNFNSMNQSNKINQDPTLIKSVAREIINGLKENNMSLYDNSSINSYKNNQQEKDNYSEYNNNSIKSSKSRKSKSSNKVKDVVETIEDFVIDKETNTSKSYSEYAGWFFDECFNYKDFLILFILYFVLSQEMIKDFFAKYFSSLNPDFEGKISVQGVIIYGLILTVLFMLIRKIF